jgi:hypothetical protein
MKHNHPQDYSPTCDWCIGAKVVNHIAGQEPLIYERPLQEKYIALNEKYCALAEKYVLLSDEYCAYRLKIEPGLKPVEKKDEK